MRKSNKKQTVSAKLRDTLRERGMTAYGAAKQAGVSVDAVQRFMNSERSLSLPTVDKLADALDLTLCPEEKGSEGNDSR